MNDEPLRPAGSRGIQPSEKEAWDTAANLNGVDRWPFFLRVPSQLLKEGDNLIKIEAVNLKGERAVLEQPVVFRPARPNIHVVAIGINEYREKQITNLRYAEQDARAFADYFIREIGVAEENVHVLLGQDANRFEMRHLLGTKLKKKARKEDQIILYFAGHGAPEEEPDTENTDGLEKYILPYDATLDSLYASAIAMEEMDKLLHRYASEAVVLVLDTCFSGQAGDAGRTLFKDGVRGNITDEFYNRLARSKGRIIMTASGPNQLSHEIPEFGHGAFTYFLLEALEGKGDYDRDGIITAHEVYQHATKTVPDQTGQNQMPQIYGSGGDVVLGYTQLKVTKFENMEPRARTNSGRLILTVSPSDAEILVDGRVREKTKGNILNTPISEGEHRLEVRGYGYVSDTRRLDVVVNSTTELEITLEESREEPPQEPVSRKKKRKDDFEMGGGPPPP